MNRLSIWFFLLLTCVTFTFVACSDKKIEALDSELLGVWHTETPKYKDRYIIISEEFLTLGAGEHNPTIYFIRNIQKEVHNNFKIVTLLCAGANGNEFIFELHFTSTDNGLSLKLKNQNRVVWHKKLN